MAQYKGNKSRSAHHRSSDKQRRLWQFFAIGWVLILLFFLALTMGWLGYMPSLEELENPRSNLASEVISDDGEMLGLIGVENRSYVSYDSISLNVINALIATEDVRFRNHSGIDPRSLGRVFVKTLVGRHRSSGGGSTITQQLAKNQFKVRKKSRVGQVFGKFKEWVIAVRLEHRYSKDEIIAMYLNTVDFGANSFGIRTASNTFFGKEPSQLEVQEAAVLVGLLKAPTAYNPRRNPEAALNRRNTVLSQMHRYQVSWLNHDGDTVQSMTDEDYAQLCAMPIDMSHYHSQSHNDGPATYLREYVRNYMNDWCKKSHNGRHYDLYKDGLKIYTTIDSRMQRYAEQAVCRHMGETIQPAFDREKRGKSPFDSKDQEQRTLVQAMKQSDRYREMRRQGKSEDEVMKCFKEEKVPMTIFCWKGSEASRRDTVMTPWDSLLYYKKYLNVGLMAVEPGTGYVKAYVGGINYRYFKYDNVTQATRQVGSTFKPFVYTMAIQDQPNEGGFSPCRKVPNVEDYIDVNGTHWWPRNSTHAREGEMVTLRWGLANSVNWISAYLMKQGSPESVINIARRMGVVSPIDAVPAICVGTPEVTVYEMAGAMATYANYGDYVQPIFITRITDKNGETIETFPADQTPPNLRKAYSKQFGNIKHQVHRKQAIADTTAYIILNMMQSVVSQGTGARVASMLSQYKPTVAGKTGTTQNNSDCWFVGITPKNPSSGRGGLATVVWTGGEVRSIHFTSMEYGQGARLALPIYGYFMQGVYSDPTLKFYRGPFAPPSTPFSTFLGNCDEYVAPVEEDEFVRW